MTVNLNSPPPVGVPESTPEDDKFMPGGSDPAVSAKLNGAVPPAADMDWL